MRSQLIQYRCKRLYGIKKNSSHTLLIKLVNWKYWREKYYLHYIYTQMLGLALFFYYFYILNFSTISRIYLYIFPRVPKFIFTRFTFSAPFYGKDFFFVEHILSKMWHFVASPRWRETGTLKICMIAVKPICGGRANLPNHSSSIQPVSPDNSHPCLDYQNWHTACFVAMVPLPVCPFI